MRKVLAIATVSLLFFGCGKSLQESSGAPDIITANPVKRSYFVFDPFSKEPNSPIGIPFPNDLFWKEGKVVLNVERAKDPEERALYEAVNSLNLKGLSPNTPIFVPLSSDREIDLESLKGRFFLFDLTSLKELAEGGSPQSPIDCTSSLVFLQEGRYLKFYPVKPLSPGHEYLFVILSGVKDFEGKEVLPAQIYNQLESTEPLKDKELEKLREAYQTELYGKVFPLLTKLTGIEFNRESVEEAFTFTTANKTLSLEDFKSIEAYLKGETSTLQVEGLPYSNIQAELDGILQVLNSANFIAFLKGLAQKATLERGILTFPAVSIRKLGELLTVLGKVKSGDLDPNGVNWGDYISFIPLFVGNKENYDGEVYIFQHGLGSSKERAGELLEGIPLTVVAIDLPFHGDYTSLTSSQEPDPNCLNEEGKGSGKCFLTGNPISDRLNIYQAVFNIALLEKLLREGTYDLNGDGKTDVPRKVNFVGVSMGSITGEVAFKSSTLDRAVFSVGGGNLVSIVDSAKNQLIESLLESTGIKKNTNAYGVVLGLFQLILDPADPTFHGLTPERAQDCLFQSACCDTVVPPVSNRAFGNSLYGNATPVYLRTFQDFEDPPAEPKWYVYGDASHWVIHSFLLKSSLENYPEVAPHTDEEYLKAATKGAQRQAYKFLTSD